MEKDIHNNICEESVFELIYKKYISELSSYLYYKYGEQFSPNDKAQEAFIKLWNNCKNVTVGKAKAFLYTVANNMVLNEVKHQKVVLRYKQTIFEDRDNESPEFILEKKQYLEHYQKVLSNLSHEQRTAFLLSKVEGKKHSEIAEMLGVTQKVVEYRIYSAFNILKRELKGFKLK